MAETGFQRKLKETHVLALLVGCAVGWGAFVMPGNTFLTHAGTLGTTLSICVAVVAMMLLTMNYGYLIDKFPYAGGEIIYVKRAFGESLGFISAWFLVGAYISVLIMNTSSITLIGRTVFGGVLQGGYHYSIAGFDIYFGEVIIPRMILIVLLIICVRGLRISANIQLALVIVLIAGVVFSFAAGLISPEGSALNWQPAFYPGKDINLGMFAVFAMMPWAFVGFDTANQFCEETKFPVYKLKKLMLISVPIIAALYIVLNLYAATVTPAGYDSWVEYVNDLGNLSGLKSIPTFYAAYQVMGDAGVVILVIAIFGGILTGILGCYLASGRVMYCMAREKMLGRYFGELNDNHVPANAMTVVLIIALLTSFMGRTVLGWMSNMLSVGITVVFFLVSASAIKFAIRDKKIGIVFTGIFGMVMSVVIFVVLMIPIEGLGGSLTMEEYICLAVYTLVGITAWILIKKLFRPRWKLREEREANAEVTEAFDDI